MKNGFNILPLWTLVICVSVASTLMLTWLAQKGITELNNIINPCTHGGSFNGTVCDCTNSQGLFTGQYCEEHNCQNFGVLTRYSKAIRDDVISLYGCRCPTGPTRRWAGLLCDKCYATNATDGCSGDCDGSELGNNAVVVPGSRRQCDKICLPDGGVFDCAGIDVGYNGACVACNGHGTCDNNGECVCQTGWYDSEDGLQCVESCTNADGTSICGKNAECEMVNGKAKCFCRAGFWNEPECDVVCPGVNPNTYEGIACNGHGACYYDGEHQEINGFKFAFCACDPTYDAEGSEACQWECPHRPTVQLPCSGHGKCKVNSKQTGVECTCNVGAEIGDTWAGKRCDCNEQYSCFGHGECEPTTGECLCYNGGNRADVQPFSLPVSVYTYIHADFVPDTYKFATPAHYIVTDTAYDLFTGMVVNITNGVKTMPVTLKTVVSNNTERVGEFEEAEANAIAKFFNYHETVTWTGKEVVPVANSKTGFNFSILIPYNWNPTLAPTVGFYTGPRCLECQHNWYPSPVMGDSSEACNVFCNPSAEYKWYDASEAYYPFSGQDGFGCWGRGQCEYEKDLAETASCKCDEGTDPETHCAQCKSDLYPKLQWTAAPVEKHCSIQCIDSSCNGHGRCNPYAYNTGKDDLCICDLNRFGMDTVNASTRCSTCQDHWFPEDPNDINACSEFCSDDIKSNMDSGCQNLVKVYSDTKEDILLTTFNNQGEEKGLITRIAAPEQARTINCLNCQAGTCNREAQCTCPAGVTGVECNKACLSHNGNVCGGHGECGQNELFTLFNPESDLTQCECYPEDEYTEDTRDYYQRTGVVLDPPPNKNYYGSSCEYHCPTYNEDVCAARGDCNPVPVEGYHQCKQSIQLSDDENPLSCKNVMTSESIDGVFCSVTSSPWDAKASVLYKTPSYFNSPSPGAVQCKTTACQTDVNERDWSKYCVSMLKGLYPSELNSPTCAHNKEHDSQCAGLNGHVKCSTALEDAFSRAKTCSDFDFVDNGSIRIYDAWDVDQMGVTTVVINVKYLFQNDDKNNWREMTPFVFDLAADGKTYSASKTGQSISLYTDINNTLVVNNIGCGDTYGLKWNKPISGSDADGTGYLSYTTDTCTTTNCAVEQFTTNPWHDSLNSTTEGVMRTSQVEDWPNSILIPGAEEGVTTGISVEQAGKIAINNAKYNKGGGYFVYQREGKRVWYYTETPPRNSVGGFYVVDKPGYVSYRAGIPVSNQKGCCKCNGVRDPLLDKALDTANTEYFIHNIQLYHKDSWCAMSNSIFENAGALNDDCAGANAQTAMYAAAEHTCYSHTDMVDCTTDSHCLYDISVDYQKKVKNICSDLQGRADACDADNRCVYYGNTGKCSPRSFCRAKTCEDTINDIGISNFCIDLNLPDWCPADPTNVKVSYKPFSTNNTYLKNVDKVEIPAATLDECAQNVAVLDKELFDFDGAKCFWYDKLFDLQLGVGKTTFKIRGYTPDGLAAFKTQWSDQCFSLSSEVTAVTGTHSNAFKPSDLFFRCWNLNEKNYPFVLSATGTTRGGIKLTHEDQFRTFVSSVGRAKQDSRWNPEKFPSSSDKIEVNSAWCKNHINSRYPTGDLDSWADTAKSNGFTTSEYATICSAGAGKGDVCMGFHTDALKAAKHATFWENVFQRQHGPDWGCVTRDKHKVDTWDPGPHYSLTCYNYENNAWVISEEYPMDDPNIRYKYLSLLTPKELESCVMTPNVDAFMWDKPDYDVITRTRSTCTNVDATTKSVLNNAILFEMLKDSERIVRPMGETEVEKQTLSIPELLYRSRLQGINKDEEDVFYVHRHGTCVGDCVLHTKSPFDLPDTYFDNETTYDRIRAWCDGRVECDGFTYETNKNHWFAWSFIGGSYEFREYSGYVSYIKSSSLQDDCKFFDSDTLFQPEQTIASTYSIPDVSQSVIVNGGTIEFTKKQAGAVHMDGWTDNLNLLTTRTFGLTTSNLVENANFVAYERIQINTAGLEQFTNRYNAEVDCYTQSNDCGGLVYPSTSFDQHGNRKDVSGVIYKVPYNFSPLPADTGNAFFAPNAFVFDIDADGKIRNNVPVLKPYDLEIIWPDINLFGSKNVTCYAQWHWVGTAAENHTWCLDNANRTQWEVGDDVITPHGMYSIKYVDFTFDGKDPITVFGVDMIEASGTFQLVHAKIYKTSAHIPVGYTGTTEVDPVTVCLANPRSTGEGTMAWDYFSSDITGCKFETTVRANGHMKITPDGIDIDGTYAIVLVTPTGNNTGSYVIAKQDTLHTVDYNGTSAVVASTTTIQSIPAISFSTEGTVALSFTRDGKECFSLDIVDDFGYVNKRFDVSIPALQTGDQWNVKYENGLLKVNDNLGVQFVGNKIPNKIDVWNTVSNTTSRIVGLKKDGVQVVSSDGTIVWSSAKSMHPGRTYVGVQTGHQSRLEKIKLYTAREWETGGWVPTHTTQMDTKTVTNKEECIQFATDYDWTLKKPNTGPVLYLHLNANTCTIYWDTVLARSATEPGHTLRLPRTQFHVSGWMYAEASTSATRAITVHDVAGNRLASVTTRAGSLLDKTMYPTATTIAQDAWHYWSVDITRVRPMEKNAVIEVTVLTSEGESVEFEENSGSTHQGVYSLVDNGMYKSGMLTISPILETDVFATNGSTWSIDSVSLINNVSYFKGGLFTVNTFVEMSYTTYEYTVVVEVDQSTVYHGLVTASSGSLHGGSVKMSNNGFDNTEFRLSKVIVRNRRASSLCNVKDLLFDLGDETAVQTCTYSHSCYEKLNSVDKFSMCENNLKYEAPDGIEGDDTRALAAEMQWVSYCDYAFPHSLHYDGTKEQCEGIWLSVQLNDDLPRTVEINSPMKRAVGVVYNDCSKSSCENVNQGFLAHLKCTGTCKNASFVYIDSDDNEQTRLLFSKAEPITVEIVDRKMIRCNSDKDHYGIYPGDWLGQCREIDERFPLFECFDGRQEESWNGEKKVIGSGNNMGECRKVLRAEMLNGEYPTAMEIVSGDCVAMYNTEANTKFLTQRVGSQTCFIRYGGIPDIRKPVSSVTVPDCHTYPYDNEYFTSCFAKTQEYTASCSETCINRLRLEVDDKDCQKVENLRNIARLTGNECAQGACQQEVDKMVSKQFCAYQKQYHNIQTNGIESVHTLYIPDLETTRCTDQCQNHLERSLDYHDWEGWCLSYASGEILGLCSRTDCSCNAGYDGTQCELKCPMGSSDGKDATCSGSNGFCVPKDASDVFQDKSRQDTAREYDSNHITNYPPWITGPSTVKGICECIVGSGVSCELRCSKNNNGTFGPNHNNQFGICDTYLAITKPLPPCSRYNANALTDDGGPVSYNSTTYDRSRILHPERLMFCTDEEMIEGATLSAYDDAEGLTTNDLKYTITGIANDTVDTSTKSTERHMKDATVVFQKMCFPYPNDNVFSFKVTEYTAKKYTQGPTYDPAQWSVVVNVTEEEKSPLTFISEKTIDMEKLWLGSISDTFVTNRISTMSGYFNATDIVLPVSSVFDCAISSMQRYETTKGMFYMKGLVCHLQNASVSLTKAQWLNEESPRPPSLLTRDTRYTSYFVDMDDIPIDARPLRRPVVSLGHGMDSVGLTMGANVHLWLEEMPDGSERIGVTATTDGTVSAHVITYGTSPYNRKLPGFVKVGSNRALVFGGRLKFSDNALEDSNELFRVDTGTLTFALQSIVTVAFSEPLTSGTPPTARANPVLAWDNDKTLYVFGGNTVSYDATGTMQITNAANDLYSLDTSTPTGIVKGESSRETWLWTQLKTIDYGTYSPGTREAAWAIDSKILMTGKECWIGPFSIQSNVCVDATPSAVAVVHPSTVPLTSQTMRCDLKISQSASATRKVTLGDESRPIAVWETPINMYKYLESFTVWYHDWSTIDSHFGSDFKIRFRNIFQITMIQNERLTVIALPESLPRASRYTDLGASTTNSGNVTVTSISIDECRSKCNANNTCSAFDYVENTGACILNSGRYVKTLGRGHSLIGRDDYKSKFLDSGYIETVNAYFKRAKMMQGKYSVLDELGIETVTDERQGYDWMIRREVGPSKFTKVPVSDGSKTISLYCTSHNCARSSAVAFQKAKYTKKKAKAMCGVMDSSNCLEPCELVYDTTYTRTVDTACSNGYLYSFSSTIEKCLSTCTEMSQCNVYTMMGSTCSLYNSCTVSTVSGVNKYEKYSYCDIVEAFTIPKMYYMVDFITPMISQTETYRLVQGPYEYTVTVKYAFDETKSFDTAELNSARVWTMDNNDITVDIRNANGLGGVRILWSEDNGWLYKSRQPFHQYVVDQYTADSNLHRGGTCGNSASDACPGSKTFYNVPCNGRGTCELSCECVCDKAPEEYYLDAQRTTGSVPDNPDGGSVTGMALLVNNPAKTPFRGPDCAITCPGYDGWTLDNVCSGRGSCGDRGQCICDYGYTGDNCQFMCPGFDPLNKFESVGKICGKKGSCTVADKSVDSFRASDKSNKNRFLDQLRKFYQPCHAKFKATALKMFVGDICTSDADCHSGICDTLGVYHGCKGLCVQPTPEIFPSQKGILIDHEPFQYEVSPRWRDYNCPKNQDIWYDTMWAQMEGEIGHVGFDGDTHTFVVEDSLSNNYKLATDAQTACENEATCMGKSGDAFWVQTDQLLYFREVLGGNTTWIKNPFTTDLGVFITSAVVEGSPIGSIADSVGDRYTLSSIMKGNVDGICEIPSQQKSETPWVKRPESVDFVQKYDEPVADKVLGGYPAVFDWGYEATSGRTTLRDLDAPTITTEARCEIMPDFTLRCPVCDCFSDSIQGYWDGPTCTACKRGYATKTCKKTCPGYDGKNDGSMCSGNGACNYGIDGSGRCMCGGSGGGGGGKLPLYKDQDFRPTMADESWCNKWTGNKTCDDQPYCFTDGDICHTTQDSDSGEYSGNSRPAVTPVWPKVHEHPYYIVQHRDFSSFIWPIKKYVFSRIESGRDVNPVKMKGVSKGTDQGPVTGVAGWYPDSSAITTHYYEKKTNTTFSVSTEGQCEDYYNMVHKKKYPYSVFKLSSALVNAWTTTCELWAWERNQCVPESRYAPPTWSNCEKECVTGTPQGCIVSKYNNNVYYNEQSTNKAYDASYTLVDTDEFSSKRYNTIRSAKAICDGKYDCKGLEDRGEAGVYILSDSTTSLGVIGGTYTTYVKVRKGEEGCIDFNPCVGECSTDARWFGNNMYEGCCKCGGGLRGHGIPESMTRWLYAADDATQYNNVIKNAIVVQSNTKIELDNNSRQAVKSIQPPNADVAFTVEVASNGVWSNVRCKRIGLDGKCVGTVVNELDDIAVGNEIRIHSDSTVGFTVNLATQRCINTYVDTQGLYTKFVSGLLQITEASNTVCHHICRNGFPQKPQFDVTLGYIQINKIYNGCCECAAQAQNRLASFWNIRVNGDKLFTSDFEKTSWWSPRAYTVNEPGGLTNVPMEFAYFPSRLAQYATKQYAECPSQDCENDCKLCKSSKSGFNCAATCTGCLLSGSCDNSPTLDGITLCTCVSDSLNPRAGCCPAGFNILTSIEVLNRKTQINGIKGGLMTYYDFNKGEKTNRASSYYVRSSTDLSTPNEVILENGFYAIDYNNLLGDRLMSGCYPCPGVLSSFSLCDKSTECSIEDSELTAERMWALTANLEALPGGEIVVPSAPWYYAPQTRTFPFGYPLTDDFSEYSEFEGYGPPVGSSITSGNAIVGVLAGSNVEGYDTIEKARNDCDVNSDCFHISQIQLGIISSYTDAINNPITNIQCEEYANTVKKTMYTLTWLSLFENNFFHEVGSWFSSLTEFACKKYADATGKTFVVINDVTKPNECYIENGNVFYNHKNVNMAATRVQTKIPFGCFPHDNDIYYNGLATTASGCTDEFPCLQTAENNYIDVMPDNTSYFGELIDDKSLETCKSYGKTNGLAIVYNTANKKCRLLGTASVQLQSGSSYKVMYGQNQHNFYLFGTGDLREYVYHRSVSKIVNSNKVPYLKALSTIFASSNIANGACDGNKDLCVASLSSAERDNPFGMSLFSSRLGCSSCSVNNVYNTYDSSKNVDGIGVIDWYDLGHSYSVGCAKCLPGSGGVSAINRLYDFCYPEGCVDLTLSHFKSWDKWQVGYPNRACNGLVNTACRKGSNFLNLVELSFEPLVGCTRCPAGKGFGYDIDGDQVIDDPQFNSNAVESIDNDIYIGNGLEYALGAIKTNDPEIFSAGHGQMVGTPATIRCRECPVNTFSTTGTNCHVCPGLSGTKGLKGQTRCVLCGPGTFYATDISDITVDKCKTCTPGMYQPLGHKKAPSKSVPKNWNDGTYTDYTALPSSVKNLGGCDTCPSGKYNPFSGSTVCYDCPVGRKASVQDWSTSGSRMPRTTMQEACEVCSQGKYNTDNGLETCTGICPNPRI